MPRKARKKKPAAGLPAIPNELIDGLISGPMSAEAINAASMAFKNALIERALGAEMSHHLCYPPGADKPAEATNHRNGVSAKTVLTEDGPLCIDVPRDRQSQFKPVLIPKHEWRFTGFDDKIVAGHDGSRDPGFLDRSIRHRGITGVHQLGHRCSDGRGERLAVAPA